MIFRLRVAFLLLVPFTARSDPFVVDEAFLDNAITLGELSNMAKDPPTGIDSANFYRQAIAGSASYIVMQEDDICYAAMAGKLPSDVSTFMDRMMNLVTRNMDYMDEFKDGCTVQTPVNKMYKTLENLETDVRECVATCGDTPCPLRLTGHGMGGGLALALGVAVADLSPKGMTFGSVAAIGAGCNAIESSDWVRFVNAVESQYRIPVGYPKGGLVYDFVPLAYDPVPYRFYSPAEHFGYHAILSYNFTVASLGLDDTQTLDHRFLAAHSMEWPTDPVYDEFAGYAEAGYLDRLRLIRDLYQGIESAYPLPLGFGHRDLCTVDAQCGLCEYFECDDPHPLECFKDCFLCPPRCNVP